VIPWNYFQLNSVYFNTDKGIFSKLEMDNLIPGKWRLQQHIYDASQLPHHYPVFLKPEWGQNSNGIVRADNDRDYREFEKKADATDVTYIVQEAAKGNFEYEIYFLRSPENKECCSFFSMSKVINVSEETYPINSIHNSNTFYEDITSSFNKSELQTIWGMVKDIGPFRMARVGVKADNAADLLRGIFQIIEINIYLPMPLVLLSANVSRNEKFRLIDSIMKDAAALVKTIPPEETGKRIFFRKLRAHYKVA